jgi:hypothetical protein
MLTYTYLKTNSLAEVRSLRLTYRTLIHFATIYGVETWWMTVANEKNLRSLARRILRKIFGLVQDRGKCRICYNVVLYELIEGHDNVRVMKPQRIK